MSVLATATTTVETQLALGAITPRISQGTRARRFVWTVMITYVAGLAALAAFSIYVNPWGDFGQVGFFEPSEYNDRLLKANYLDRLNVDDRPQVLVLGSSSMMCIRPEDIVSETGKTTFNNYVSGGQADDHLCLLKHIVNDLGYWPEWLVVGLETWTFGPPSDRNAVIPGVRRALTNVPQWIRHHPQGSWYRRLWAKTVDCVSRDHLIASWTALFKDQRDRRAWEPLGQGIVALDGTLTYKEHDRMKLGGQVFMLSDLRRLCVTSLLQQIKDEQKSSQLERLRYYLFDGLWPPRVQRFEEFLSLCHSEGIKVLLVRTPLHPLAWEMLENHPEHSRNVAELDRLLNRWHPEFPNTLHVFDASHIENFEGDPDGFYDEMHSGPENSRQIVSRITPILNAP